MVAEGDALTVLWEGTLVGRLTVTEVVPRPPIDAVRLEGAWTPAAGFAVCQPFLEENHRLGKAWEDNSDDDEAYEHFVDSTHAIIRRLRLLPELPGKLANFGVENDKAWLLFSLPSTRPWGPVGRAPRKYWKPGDPIPVPSHLAGWVSAPTYQEKVLTAAVRCPCGSERLEFRSPGVTHLVDNQPAPCSAEIGKEFFFLIQAVCPDCRNEHVLFDSHFHGCDGFLNPESEKRTLPRPRLWPWRCWPCGSAFHTGEVRVVLDYEDAYFQYGYADQFGDEHWPDAFGWFGMGLQCCGCGQKTPVWVDFETR